MTMGFAPYYAPCGKGRSTFPVFIKGNVSCSRYYSHAFNPAFSVEFMLNWGKHRTIGQSAMQTGTTQRTSQCRHSNSTSEVSATYST